MLTNLDKKIISLICQDIPLVKDPFENLALRLGIEKRVLLKRMQTYKKKGIMRKFSASLNHKKIGFKHNAMAVWNVPDRFVNNSGNVISSFVQVSHCYQRKKAPEWNYNLYSMIHGKTKKECLDIVKSISKKIACNDYKILFSSQEYKKTPPEY